MRKVTAICIFLALCIISINPARGLEKIKYSNPAGPHPLYVLPVLAGQEQGYWKQQGLEVEHFQFRSSTDMYRGVSAGSIDVGVDPIIGMIQAAAAGVPVVAVLDQGVLLSWNMWVRTDSKIRRPSELKGAIIGVTRRGSVVDLYARAIAEALGLTKDVKFVATGGVREAVAGLRSGAIDSTVMSPMPFMPLIIKGAVKELLPLEPYLPKPWIDVVLWVKKDLLNKPQAKDRLVKGLLQSLEFVQKNREWSVQRMVSPLRRSKEVASRIFPYLVYKPAARINGRAVDNVRNFLIKYKVITPEKAPSLESLYKK